MPAVLMKPIAAAPSIPRNECPVLAWKRARGSSDGCLEKQWMEALH